MFWQVLYHHTVCVEVMTCMQVIYMGAGSYHFCAVVYTSHSYHFPLPPGPPTMQELLSFSAEKVNIAIKVGVRYIKFGVFLLEDTNGDIVKALEMEHHWDAEQINMAILLKWLQGKGVKPVTWSTLITVLQTIGM